MTIPVNRFLHAYSGSLNHEQPASLIKIPEAYLLDMAGQYPAIDYGRFSLMLNQESSSGAFLGFFARISKHT